MARPHVHCRVPRATYRIQLSPAFGFREVEEILDYLDELGVSDIYASPVLQARPASQHGYDVVDPTQISRELGGIEAFQRMSDALRRRGMGLLLDVVPNHMAAHAENAWWWDVLLRGRGSRYARWFDIDWQRGGGKIVLPVLGAPLREVVERGEIRVAEDGREVHFHDQRFPVADTFDARPLAVEARPEALLKMLGEQHYQLVSWKEGPQRINYRRFFDISDLVAVRPEDPEAFQAMHRLLAELMEQQRITGLRIDHIDGLADPQNYLEQLQRMATDAAAATGARSCYLLVEKILAPGENLPQDWPVCGTTGYDVLNVLGGLWIHPQGARRIIADACERTGVARSFEQAAYAAKQEVIQQMFSGDLQALAECLVRTGAQVGDAEAASQAIAALTAALPAYRTYIKSTVDDQDRRHLQQALTALADEPLPDEARRALRALAALLLNPSADGAGAEFIRRWQQFSGPVMAKGVEDTAMYRAVALVSLNEVGGHLDVYDDAIDRFHQAAMKRLRNHPHQLNATSTHDTKRSEDVRARIAVLSECAEEWVHTLERWTAAHHRFKKPNHGHMAPSMRDELLLYQTLLGVWPHVNEESSAAAAVDAILLSRITAYMKKAAREAKLETSWTEPAERYENTLQHFIESILAPDNAGFRQDLERLSLRLGAFGALNSLSQTLLKLTMPGVPDVYQGNELWDLSLVDPDNRRPVDYSKRRLALARFREESMADPAAAIHAVLDRWQDGSPKIAVTSILMHLRHQHPMLFDAGEYQPLGVEGPLADHVVAFCRRHGDQWMIVAAGRLLMSIEGFRPFGTGGNIWEGTVVKLPVAVPQRWRHLFSNREMVIGEQIELQELFRAAPLAVLLSITDAR
jgi:(1->4)-alpha-D-glucan 1-alpha-D-glucosylmutase